MIHYEVGTFKVENLKIEGLKLITPKKIGDSRGYFAELFRDEDFSKIGVLPTVQENVSRSQKGVLRGLHYQFNEPQAKLITVLRGKIFDVVVDIRQGSVTFGRHQSVILDASEPRWFWVPTGFAHGFCVISEEGADITYKTSTYYNPQGEGALRWNDEQLKISWPTQEPILSGKDKIASTWSEYLKSPKF